MIRHKTRSQALAGIADRIGLPSTATQQTIDILVISDCC